MIRHSVGERVQLPSGERGVVVKARSNGMLMIALADRNVSVSSTDVEVIADCDSTLRLGDSQVATLKAKMAVIDHSFRFDPNSGLRNARIEPQPHQVFVAARTLQKLQARMILSDEVGLGKTIEAGLILKSLRVQNLLGRVLIITPASIQLQWQSEMHTKFGERFDIMTGDRLRMLRSRLANPWSESTSEIVSLNLASKPHTADQLAEVPWDLVIIDEAHKVRKTVRGSNVHTTQAYRMAEGLRDVTSGLLLLSATPMQLHPIELYGLIELVEPGLFPTFASFQRQRKKIPKVNELMRTLDGWDFLDRESRVRVLAKHRDMLMSAGISELQLDETRRAEALDRLSDQHPYANVLIRNRKSALGIYSDRRARSVMVSMTPEERQLYGRVTDYLRAGFIQAAAVEGNALGFLMVTYQKMLTSSSNALRHSLRKRADGLRARLAGVSEGETDIASMDGVVEAESAVTELMSAEAVLDSAEAEIVLLEELASDLDRVEDSKAAALEEILHRGRHDDPDAKTVVFTQFVQTQSFLRFFLEHRGFEVAIFHGGMSSEQKEAAIADFRDSASVLVSTESGAEGRNLQFANHLVNYDLPWNPMRVEQRIGRLDRIGQEKPVFIYNLAYEDTLEERVLEVLGQRIKLFEESIGALDPILSQVERGIEKLVRASADRGEQATLLTDFGRSLEDRVNSARRLESLMADLALDRASFRSSKAQEILARHSLVDHEVLRSVLEEALPLVGGGSIRDHPEVGQVFVLSPKSARQFSHGKHEIHGVFDPAVARSREELPLFSPEHPVVEAILTEARAMDPAGIGSRTCTKTPPGQWLEVVVRVRAHSKGLPTRPRVELLRILVPPPDAESINGTSVEVLKAFDFDSVPIQLTTLPRWVEGALETAGEICDEQFKVYRVRFESAHLQDLKEAREVAERIHHQAMLRIRHDIERERKWIEDNASSRDPKIQQVMPARQGKLKKASERLSEQRANFDNRIADLEQDRLTVEIQELWNGLVQGRGA